MSRIFEMYRCALKLLYGAWSGMEVLLCVLILSFSVWHQLEEDEDEEVRE